MTEEQDIVWASSHFLTSSLPSNWHKWSEKKLDNFLEEHKWQMVEDWSIDDLWQQIGQVARSMRDYINKERNK